MLVASAAMAQAPATSSTPNPQAPQPAQTPAASTPANAPIVRVSDRPATDTRDARVDMGGFRISMPGNPISASGPGPVRADGAIVVPSNTLGEGLSLQQRNDLIGAQIRQEQARAFFDERVAERALPDTRWGFIAPGSVRRGGFGVHDGGWSGNDGGWRDARPGVRRGPLVGPVATTVTTSDQLGAQAQRNFAEASTPRVAAIEQGRADAVKRFDAAATPAVARIQGERSEAFLRAQRESPAPK